MITLLLFALLAAQQGAPVAAPAAPTAIPPTMGGGQVGQAPQNSAMRAANGSRRPASPKRANPTGMAGLGAGMSGGKTSGLTLSAGGSDFEGMQSRQREQIKVRVTDTGVTQRSPGDGKGPR